MQMVATGLRNSVGIAFSATDGPVRVVGQRYGRNNLGPHLPPDELNLIQPGVDYTAGRIAMATVNPTGIR